MKSFIDWLSNHRYLNILLALSYFLVVVLPHKRFGTFLNKVVFKGITRDQYNLYVASMAAIVGIILAIILFRNIRKSESQKLLFFYSLSTMLFAILIVKFLFVINIEVIHFPQYALFAILIFPLVKNYRSALIFSTIAGSIDEAYQYFYLAPNDTGYYDFNDVVTNVVGAAFGVIILRSFDIKGKRLPKFLKSFEFWTLIILSGVIGLLFLANVLSFYPEEGTPFSVLKGEINGFWSTVYPNITYHVVRPLEGLAITGLLWIFYSRL